MIRQSEFAEKLSEWIEHAYSHGTGLQAKGAWQLKMA